jgi:hypothetical protein
MLFIALSPLLRVIIAPVKAGQLFAQLGLLPARRRHKSLNFFICFSCHFNARARATQKVSFHEAEKGEQRERTIKDFAIKSGDSTRRIQL